MVDTHTHLNFKSFKDDWQQIIDDSLHQGVEKMIVVGTDLDSSRQAIDMASSHLNLFASVGIHPHHAKGIDSKEQIPQLITQLESLAQNKKVVAIGEVGLDYHYYQKSKHENKIVSPQLIEIQKELFKAQIQLASQLDKPLIIHSREARSDVLDLILNSQLSTLNSISGVFHCFDGSKKYAKKIIAAGFYISFTGNITYNPDRADVAKTVPLDHLLLETDCPFMKPQPNHTQELRSLPSDVKIIGRHMAKLTNIPEEEVFAATTHNAQVLFRI